MFKEEKICFWRSANISKGDLPSVITVSIAKAAVAVFKLNNTFITSDCSTTFLLNDLEKEIFSKVFKWKADIIKSCPK